MFESSKARCRMKNTLERVQVTGFSHAMHRFHFISQTNDKKYQRNLSTSRESLRSNNSASKYVPTGHVPSGIKNT